VFIDESSAKTNLTRLRGRGPRGQRVHGTAPSGHWHTTTMIGAVRLDGTNVCSALEGATDTVSFRAFVEQILVPFLRPGDIVIMDNLGAHKSEPTLELIRQAGAEALFLPPYSPDLNPIEKMWSKIKNSLRTSAARTLDTLTDAIAHALNQVSCQDAIGWFGSCGYNII
jgi:transposase